MKSTKFLFTMLLIALINQPFKSKAQTISDLLEQLSLDYQKLAGMKSTLNEMYNGYDVLYKGYNAVSDVSKGSFNLHEAFLDGLYLVSPSVRKYPHIKDIVNDQASLISEYNSAYNFFRRNRHFSPVEVNYMGSVYNNLVKQSLKSLSDLAMILTDKELRMSDAERLSAIDRIYGESHGQLNFLRKFNNETSQIAALRAKDEDGKNTLKSLYGIK